MMVLHGTSDDTIETLLGLNRTEDYESAEREDPEMLAVIWPYDSSITPNIPLHLDPSAMAPLSGAWHGKAYRLSVENPVAWDIIPAVAAASWKTTTETMRVLSASVPRFSTDLADRGPVSAGEIIHRRRSAVDFDGIGKRRLDVLAESHRPTRFDHSPLTHSPLTRHYVTSSCVILSRI